MLQLFILSNLLTLKTLNLTILLRRYVSFNQDFSIPKLVPCLFSNGFMIQTQDAGALYFALQSSTVLKPPIIERNLT